MGAGIDPAALEALLNEYDDIVEEGLLDDLLEGFCEHAWPSIDCQNG